MQLMVLVTWRRRCLDFGQYPHVGRCSHFPVRGLSVTSLSCVCAPENHPFLPAMQNQGTFDIILKTYLFVLDAKGFGRTELRATHVQILTESLKKRNLEVIHTTSESAAQFITTDYHTLPSLLYRNNNIGKLCLAPLHRDRLEV